MGDPARRIPTYQDVLDAPEGVTAEILGDELFLSPRPASSHGYSEGQIRYDLAGPFMRRGGGPGGWWILSEPELHLGNPEPKRVVAAPDLAGWRRERMPVLLDVAAFTLAPDWVCEIQSEGYNNVRRDRVKKPAVYAAAGIEWFWLVDPRERLLEVRRLQGGVYAVVQTFVDEDRVRAEPFEAVELEMSGWWLPAP